MVKQFKKDYQNLHLEITHIVGIQPDHPDRQTNGDELINYPIINKYDDLVTVNSSGTRNGLSKSDPKTICGEWNDES